MRMTGGPASGFHGELGRLAGADVRRGPYCSGPLLLGKISEQPAKGQGLFASGGGKLHIGIPGRDLDDVCSGLSGERGGHVALALAMSHQQKLGQSRTHRTSVIGLRHCYPLGPGPFPVRTSRTR